MTFSFKERYLSSSNNSITVVYLVYFFSQSFAKQQKKHFLFCSKHIIFTYSRSYMYYSNDHKTYTDTAYFFTLSSSMIVNDPHLVRYASLVS